MTQNIRLIPRIDIKGNNLVKGVNLEGFRALGDANLYIEKYYKDEADEILLNDVVASLYDRESLNNFIKQITKKIFIPLIVGGGIKSLQDIEYLLKSGADRIFFNSSIIKKPKLLDESVKYFGSSTIIASIEAPFTPAKLNRSSICFRENPQSTMTLVSPVDSSVAFPRLPLPK